MCQVSDWERVLAFHGHACPGLVNGYRAALAALERLREMRAEDEELVAIVENDCCAVDAVQVLTGCTFGKGNLIFRDYGKQVFTIGSRKSGRAVRVAVRKSGQSDPSYTALMNKVMAGTAGPEEREAFAAMREARIRELLEMPEEELLDVREARVDLPPKARIFRSVVCSSCGEAAMEPRVRMRDGEPVCIPCADNYATPLAGGGK
ncbi:MAG: FmdE family protein [Bacillota bacterium]|nr:FmdE family protein [Bacillota bacterium]